MQDANVAHSYEELIRVIHDPDQAMSKSYQIISRCLTQNPNNVAVLISWCWRWSTMSMRRVSCGSRRLWAIAVSRNCRCCSSAGCPPQRRGLMRGCGRRRRNWARADHSEIGFLRDLVVRDLTSLQDLLNPGGGLATHMARTLQPGVLLFAVSFRSYAAEVVNIVEEVAARGVPIVAISDSTLSSLAKNAQVLFAVPEHSDCDRALIAGSSGRRAQAFHPRRRPRRIGQS